MDELKPMDEEELMDLFGDAGEETDVPEVIAEEIELDDSTDTQIEKMEEDEGEGVIILHPDNMQVLANFIGEEQIANLQPKLSEEERLGLLSNINKGTLSRLGINNIEDIAYFSPLASVEESDDSLKFLRSIIGDDAANLIKKVANIQGKDLEDMVSIRKLPTNLNRIDVLNDSVGTAHFLQLFDDQGTDITDSIGLPLDNVGQLTADTVFEGSAMTALENGVRKYTASAMGKSVITAFESFWIIMSNRDKRTERIATLKWIRDLITRLNSVFGFDDYRQLEAFVAAWLMKNSTCRLSGIPGTGKTTVINCAATLLGNSYGFHINKTYLASNNTMDSYRFDKVLETNVYSNIKQIFANNSDLTNAHVADIVPSGQSYNVMYNDQRNDTIYRNWNGWRFRDWTRDEPGTISRSGAYTYGFNFLRTVESSCNIDKEGCCPKGSTCSLPAIDGDTKEKKSIDPQKFHKILFNCWEVEVPEDFDMKQYGELIKSGVDWKTTHPHWIAGETKFLEKKAEGKTRIVVKPVQIHDGTDFIDYSTITAPAYGPFPMTLRYPDYNGDEMLLAFDHVTDIKEYVAATGQGGLYTDTGRNEGYWMRKLMNHWFVDKRTEDPKAGQFDISVEMLNEIGIAKIDYDKRPDEVLYGLEIRAVEAVNQNGETVNTYEFEPVPREIVTQPIKFFNEANRSQSGVEDAILGLIAEKMVEYRGKTFKSPDFVAWMDTNPHQRGNDLAFTDRIDMELLFKSVSLGGRYDQLVNKFSGRGGLEPNRILVNYLMSDANDSDSFVPMRIGNLFGVWDMVGKHTKFTSPGSSYDGFREISVISVLFSQIFAKRPAGITVGGSQALVEYPFADTGENSTLDLYESPLLDYSITTNTTTSDKGTKSPVLNESTMIFGDDDHEGQLPTVFTRVLGFRFTNSLVKLSQAFAFLRGKESVSRQEILDAVPYVIAHRMGRAKSGAKDMEGNNKGLDGGRIGYVNEQEFIREMVVKGYIEGKIATVSMNDKNLMDNAEYFYNHCRSIMDSVPAVWEYEEMVIRPLYEAISTSNVLALTPIHWHIATMVIEEERKGRGRTVSRKYSASKAGPEAYATITVAPTNYPEMYSNYEDLILSPSVNGEPCLFDYYRLRGFIAREENLFTNDRDRLLRMLAGEVRSIAGADGLELDLQIGTATPVRPFPQGITPIGSDGKLIQTTYRPIGTGPWPRPEQTYWHTYDDCQGAYGKLIGFGNVNTYNLNDANSPLDVTANLTSDAANQSLRVTGRYRQTQNLGQSISRYDITKTLNQFAKNFRTSIGAGVNMGDEFPKNTNAVSTTFDEWIKSARQFLITEISEPKRDPIKDMWGCFELNHAPIVNPQMGLRGVKGDDKLRIWLRLSNIGLTASKTGGDLIDMLFTVGITSAPALTGKENVGLEAEGPDFEILSVSDTKQYVTGQWTAHNQQQGYDTNTALVDSGNMLPLDRLYYNNLFANSLE